MNRTAALALTGVALLSLATGCSSGGKLSFPAPMSVPGSGALPAGGGSPTGNPAMGSCHVKVTGDVNAEWTSPGGTSAIGYGPWARTAGAVTTAVKLDESFFILNCQGAGENYVGFTPANQGKIPMQPGDYTIEPSDNTFGASRTGGISTLLGFAGTNTNWGPSAEGHLVITEFDGTHIKGTFSIPVTDVLAKLNGTSKGNAMVTGEFDFRNPA